MLSCLFPSSCVSVAGCRVDSDTCKAPGPRKCQRGECSDGRGRRVPRAFHEFAARWPEFVNPRIPLSNHCAHRVSDGHTDTRGQAGPSYQHFRLAVGGKDEVVGLPVAMDHARPACDMQTPTLQLTKALTDPLRDELRCSCVRQSNGLAFWSNVPLPFLALPVHHP